MNKGIPEVSEFGSVDPAPPAREGITGRFCSTITHGCSNACAQCLPYETMVLTMPSMPCALRFLHPARSFVTNWRTCLDKCKIRGLFQRSGNVWKMKRNTSWSGTRPQRPWAPLAMHRLDPSCNASLITQHLKFLNPVRLHSICSIGVNVQNGRRPERSLKTRALYP